MEEIKTKVIDEVKLQRGDVEWYQNYKLQTFFFSSSETYLIKPQYVDTEQQ